MDDKLNIMLEALANSIDSLFPSVPVFKEDVPDSLPEKCFIISYAGDVDVKKQCPRLYRISGSFDISYFSESNTFSQRAEFNSVFLSLSLNMQMISKSDMKIRLNNHISRTVDNVLHDICAFDTFLRVDDDTEFIQTIERT